MKTIRWGVLGAAKFAREQMAPAIHMAKGAELYALATSDPAKAEGFSTYCPTLKVHNSYDALLADPAVDAVYIPLPNHLHVEWSLKAIAAGKHVLTEKPIAMRAGEIDALIAARDKSGLMVTEAYMIVHHPQWIRAKEWLESGEIGQLRHVDAAFTYNNESEPDNIRNRADTGGGSLPDIGVYTIGSARFVTGGEPVDLTSRIRRERGVEVYAEIAAIMANKAGRFTYQSMTSMRMYNRQVVTFQGDKGMIRLDGGPFNANYNDLAKVELHRHGNTVLTERFPTSNHYVLQVENFGHSIRTGAAYPWTLEMAKGTQAVIDMAMDRAVEFSL